MQLYNRFIINGEINLLSVISATVIPDQLIFKEMKKMYLMFFLPLLMISCGKEKTTKSTTASLNR